jgi:hypothetical protein
VGLGNATAPIFAVTVEIWATKKFQLHVKLNVLSSCNTGSAFLTEICCRRDILGEIEATASIATVTVAEKGIYFLAISDNVTVIFWHLDAEKLSLPVGSSQTAPPFS